METEFIDCSFHASTSDPDRFEDETQSSPDSKLNNVIGSTCEDSGNFALLFSI